MSEQSSFFEKLNRWFRNSISFKIFSVAFLVLILLIPTSMVQDLIRERQYRQEEAIREINSKWGNEQTISGPIISIPYLKVVMTDKKEMTKIKEFAHFLPENLKINGEILPEVRHRGIYESVLYKTNLDINGKFDLPDFSKLRVAPEDIIWQEAYMSFGISDLRGVNEKVVVSLNNQKVNMGPGIPNNDIFSSGISAPIQFEDSLNVLNFKTSLSINGSNNLYFNPIGEETEVILTSKWPNPSFSGNFLPDTHHITKEGFDVNWKILQLNRNFPQQWMGNQHTLFGSEFGLNLMLGVDQYQKNERSAKYAFMIIALSFLIFFFIEVINKKRIHPIQYLLVGFALIIFYTLLLSISEKASFTLAYLVSAIAVISLITIYVHSFFGQMKFTALLSGTLVILYGFVFVILQLEDFSLLVGSVGLFVVLATVMFATRKIDWYEISKGK